MAKILIAEDEGRIRRILTLLLCEQKHDVIDVGSGEEALTTLERFRSDLLLLDMHLPGMNGLEVLRRVRERSQPPASVMMTGYGTISTAVEAMRLGAFDYLTKPFQNEQLLQVVDRALGARPGPRTEPEPASGFGEIPGGGPAMQRVFQIIAKVAPVKAMVLITGESGTGKELVARAIHRRSPRVGRSFVAVNCSAIPQTLVESEFFGHEKGAFTDACARRTGRFEEADGGSLFLDEVGDLALEAQAKVLRVLQDQQVTPVGGGRSRRVDVRVIAATNRDLTQEVEEGRFRSDLFWRLNVVPIKLPPLRERKEDIPALCDLFLKRFNRELGLAVESICPEAQAMFAAYGWPGNVRELENTICRSMVLCDGEELKPRDLPVRIRGGIPSPEAGFPQADDLPLCEAVRQATERLEKHIITARLARCGGNRSVTAQSLGISRKTLFNKLRQFDG